jgi:integrase
MTRGDFEAAAAEWVKHLAIRRRLSPKTVVCYESYLRCGARLLPDTFQPGQLIELLAPRMGSEVTSSVRYNSYVAFTQFFRWWQGNSGPTNPLADMQPVRRSDARRRGATRTEIEALAERLADPAVSDRDRAMVLLLTWNGLRIGDIRALLVEDVDLPGRRIRLRAGKGGRDEWLTLGEPSAVALSAHLRRQAVSGHVFSSSRRLAAQGSGRKPGDRPLTSEGIRLAFKRAVGPGLQHLCPHSGRHTFATSLFRTGADANLVRRMMRHRSLNVTMTYVDDDPDAARAALARLPVDGAADKTGPAVAEISGPVTRPRADGPWTQLVRGMLPYLTEPIELVTPENGIIEGWGPFREWLEGYLKDHPEQREAPRRHPFIYIPDPAIGGDPVEVSGHTFGMMLDLARMAKPDPDGWRPRLFEEVVESVWRDERTESGSPALTLVPPARFPL